MMTYGSDVSKPPNKDLLGKPENGSGNVASLLSPTMLLKDDSNLIGMTKVIYGGFMADVISECSESDASIAQTPDLTPAQILNYQKVSQSQIIYFKKHLSWTIASGVVKHIVDAMEIKDVNIQLQAGDTPIETYAAGIGTNGGSLVATTYPVVGNINAPFTTSGSQTNNGTGHVS